MPMALVVASVAMQAYSMKKQNDANKQSAQLSKDTAAFNAKVDLAQAKQIEMDSDANTRASRQDAAVYISRQQAAAASSGVLTSGSVLSTMATTAGRLEQRILQDRVNAGREVAQREQSARMGVLYGDAQASAIKTQNSIAMLKGGSQLLSTAYGAYSSGMFSSAGGISDSRDSMLAAGAPGGVAARYGT